MKFRYLRVGTLLTTLGIVIQVNAQDPFTNGLVAFYPFNGNANDAIGANHGTVYGATLTENRLVEPNKAFSFNGTNKVLAGDSVLPLGKSPRTISLWVKIPLSTNNPNEIVFNYGVQTTSQANWINVISKTGTPRTLGSVIFDFYNSGAISTNTITFDAWQHIVCTLDGSSVARIYINGTIAGADLVTANTTTSGVLNIGDGSGTAVNQAGVVGSIDDVRIYNRALSASEVKALYDYEAAPFVGLIKAVKPSFSNLKLTTNYQLQLSGDLNTWTNHGSPFTATNTSMVYPQYWDVDNWGGLFFRLQVSP